MEKQKEDVPRGSGTITGYYVEGRTRGIWSSSNNLPRIADTQLIPEKWKRISWFDAPPGIGIKSYRNHFAFEQGILSYEAAQALIASAVTEHLTYKMSIEFRLRRVMLSYEWSIADKGVGNAINFMDKEDDEEFIKGDGNGD